MTPSSSSRSRRRVSRAPRASKLASTRRASALPGAGGTGLGSKKTLAQKFAAKELKVLGAALRALQLHSDHGAVTVAAALELLLPVEALVALPNGIVPGTRQSPFSAPGAPFESLDALVVVFFTLRHAPLSVRVTVLVDLTTQFKSNPRLRAMMARQQGWQGWLLALLPDVALRQQGPLPSPSTLSRSDSFAGSTTPGGRSAGEGLDELSASCTTIVLDVFAMLVASVLETHNGWRVWGDTIACMRRTMGERDTLPERQRVTAAAWTLSSLGVAVLSRLGRDRAEVTPVMRINLVRTLQLFEARLSKQVLWVVWFVMLWVRQAHSRLTLFTTGPVCTES